MPRPRPKRARATTRPATTTAAPEETQQSSATPPTTTNPTAAQAKPPSSDIYDVSDREKERMKRRAAETSRNPAPQTRRTRASAHLELNSEQAEALEDSRRRRDDAMERLDDLTSTTRPDEAESPVVENRGRESLAETQRQPRLTDVSGLDLDDELLNLDDSLDFTENAIEDTQSGYRSTDTSSFNPSMFRRRPRQSSVAGRDDAPIRPSSRGQNTPSISSTLNFGNFRRRAREPSILGTARKPRAQRSQSRTSQASRNGSVLGDGDDSGPDGESTPLDKTRRQTRASLAANNTEGSPSSPTRKRKSLENHEDGREKRLAVEASEEEDIHQSIEVDVEPAPTPPRGRALERERFSTPPQEDDPDMAPPLSSSASEGSPVAWPPLETLAHRTYTRKPAPRPQKTPEPDDDASDISSPPSLTHSPNYAAPKAAPKKKAPAPPKKVTTADLTSLLPRRRHKASNRSKDSTDPFDLDGSDDDHYEISAAAQDEDETSYVDSRATRRRRGAQQPLSKSASNRKGKSAEVDKGAKKRSVRTYGAANEDKENDEAEEEIVVASGNEEADEEGQEELPEEETSQMMTERIGEELQKAVKKFKEVDKWELSFEEVAAESSPGPDAR